MPSKWSQHTAPGERLLGLYTLLLFNRRKYSLTQLAEIFSCSKQTIMRQLEQIAMRREITLATEIEGGQRWVRIEAPNRDPHLSIDPESIQYLVMCRDIVTHLLPETVKREIDETVSVAAFALKPPNAEGGDGRPLATSFTKGAIDYTAFQDVIDTVLNAIRSRRHMRIEYRSATQQITQKLTVAPVKLVAYREGLYVHGVIDDGAGREPRMLPIQRIRSADILDVEVAGNVYATADVPETFGLITGEPFDVQVRVSPGAATYVEERNWSADQKVERTPDGGILLSIRATSELEIIAWVLSFAGEMEIVEPAHLRDAILERVDKLQAAHAGDGGRKA